MAKAKNIDVLKSIERASLKTDDIGRSVILAYVQGYAAAMKSKQTKPSETAITLTEDESNAEATS